MLQPRGPLPLAFHRGGEDSFPSPRLLAQVRAPLLDEHGLEELGHDCSRFTPKCNKSRIIGEIAKTRQPFAQLLPPNSRHKRVEPGLDLPLPHFPVGVQTTESIR